MKSSIIVTGASGFLGGRTAKALVQSFPDDQIIGTGRRSERKTELEQAGVTFVQGDLEEESFCMELCQNARIVVHCAALSSPWGAYPVFRKANVETTENLLKASRKSPVERFVFISTPSIYYNGKDRYRISETEPLPDRMVNNYAKTKLEAEKAVLKSNNGVLSTVALRPRAIIGAEDTVIFPRVLKAYEENRLKIIGNGKNVVDLTCVANVVQAIECAIRANSDAMGKAYNITNGEPVVLWDEINVLLEGIGKKSIKKHVPFRLASMVAGMLEKLAVVKGGKEPTLTRYGIGVLAKNFTMDISRARKELNYHPHMTTREGIREFIDWYEQHNA